MAERNSFSHVTTFFLLISIYSGSVLILVCEFVRTLTAYLSDVYCFT